MVERNQAVWKLSILSLVSVTWRLGMVQAKVGDRRGATASFEKSLQLAEAFVRDFPGNPSARDPHLPGALQQRRDGGH